MPYCCLIFLPLQDKALREQESIVLLKNLPAIPRISKKKEMRMSLEEDISYKFDETF